MAADAFNIDEVFELACQIERNGARFYRKASAQCAEPSVQLLLNELADMEDDHERRFSQLRSQVASAFSTPPGDGSDLVARYLAAIADGYVFKRGGDPAGELSGRETVEEILIKAIQLEKDSLVFYLGIQEAMDERLGREQVGVIIREEMGHISRLSGKVKDLAT